MFLKTLLLSALALLTPGGAVMNQNANSDGVDLPRSNAVNSYVPMSSHADLDMHKALNRGRSELENARSLRGKVISSGTCGENVNYSLDDTGTLTISGSGNMKNYLSMTNIPWYSNKGKIKKVIIEEGVTSIGNMAFDGCTSLSSVEIPDGVTSIERFAFYQCTSLSSVVIPESVTSIWDGAFEDCTSLSSVVIKEGVTSIGYRAFYNCTSLSSVEIPEGVTSIGERTFYGCTSLSSVVIPENVTSIGDYAFEGCTSLSDVKYCGDNQISNSTVFNKCSNLSNVKVLEDYDYDTFGGKSVNRVLDNNCEVIEPAKPSDSSSQVKPDDSSSQVKPDDSSSQVKPSDSSDVKTCDGIIYKLYDGTLKISGNGEMCSYENKESYPWYESKDNVKEIIIEGNIKSIGVNAFRGYKNLERVYIANAVSSIGEFAFEGCTNLTDVSYCGENKISTENVFNGCSKLNAVDVSKDYKYDEFGGKPVEKELECPANNVPNSESTNAAGSTSVISTALGVATAAFVLNNRRYIP